MTVAYLLLDGTPQRLSLEEAERLAPGQQFLWLHLDGRDEASLEKVRADESIPLAARSALFAHETRPRCTVMNGGALINLRGLGSTPADCRWSRLHGCNRSGAVFRSRRSLSFSEFLQLRQSLLIAR